jgi:mRNA-degrading endonuclease toxin of MazEF toxin-antitoxin module
VTDIPRRGDIWSTDTGIAVLVISSTVYNEIASEPTVIVVPVFESEPDTGFGVELGNEEWAAPGLVTSLRKARLARHRRQVEIQTLTDVNNMLFRILATPVDQSGPASAEYPPAAHSREPAGSTPRFETPVPVAAGERRRW